MKDSQDFLKQDLVDKESLLSETGKVKIQEALEALEKKKIKEFDSADDLIKELNS